MKAIITLTTDFGIHDAYVAAMRGAILNINPQAAIVDICHTIEPQNIAQAAFVFSTAWQYFPKGAIHVIVVDPGVGSQRRAIILKTPEAFFIAPDNGGLSYVIDQASPKQKPPASKRGGLAIEQKSLPPEFEAIALTNPRFWHHPVSSTFHGRDIFAPVAAHLSLGTPLHEFGEAVTSIVAFPISHPQLGTSGDLIGHIIHIDHFGNLITDVKREDLASEQVCVEAGGQRIEGLSTSYIEGNELLAILGSSGNLEIAMRNGSAAKLLGAEVGDEVIIKELK
jgi:S-adenosylmethionine hydrolase